MKNAASKRQPCTEPECDSPRYGHGLCSKHWKRMRTHGSTSPARTEMGAPQAFIERAVSHKGDECLIWPYSAGSHGYGQIAKNGIPCLAHRIVCEEVNGRPRSPDMEAAHSCGNRLCVNPNHLRWATPTANIADKRAHGTDNKSVRNWERKVTPRMAKEIRNNKGATEAQLAELYSLSIKTISRIRTGVAHKAA